MLKRASIIFMNKGPIEARFPFLNPEVCEYMLSIDKKWLELNPTNAEILLDLLEKKRLKTLEKLKETLHSYLQSPEMFNKNPESFNFDLKKIFWKFPLLVSSYYASEESFLGFDQVFNPKLRGQHGAGITSVENDITLKYSTLGKTDTEIFKKMATDIFA